MMDLLYATGAAYLFVAFIGLLIALAPLAIWINTGRQLGLLDEVLDELKRLNSRLEEASSPPPVPTGVAAGEGAAPDPVGAEASEIGAVNDGPDLCPACGGHLDEVGDGGLACQACAVVYEREAA